MNGDIYVPPALAQWAVIQGSRLMTLFALVQGVVIIFTPEARWSADAYDNALMLPGAPPSWGWIILVAGFLAVYGGLAHAYRFISVGFYACAMWCLFFGTLFFKSYTESSKSSLLGVLIFGFFAIMYVGLGEIYRNTRKARDAAHRSDT